MKEKLIQSNLMRGPNARLSLGDLRTLAQNEPDEFVGKVQAATDAGKLKLEKFRNLKGLYAALADVRVQVQMEDMDGIVRSIGTSAFPIITGSAVVAQINDAYAGVETVGQELVEDFEDNKKVTTLINVHALDKQQDEVKEDADDFPEIGALEEGVTIQHKRNGRKFTIKKEVLEENDMPMLVTKANALGIIPAEWIEEQTISRVYDEFGSKSSGAEPYVYRPVAGAAALYSSTANTPGTRAPSGNRYNSNPLVDETDLENARVRLATMKNARGRRVTIPRSQLMIMVPDALVGRALKIVNSEFVPGVENEVSNWGPRGKWNVPVARVISTPKFDDISASCWHYGAPKLQFKRKWKLRMEYVSLGMETQAYLDSRVAFQARVAWDVEIGATDYVYVIQNISSTTAPGDE